MGRFFLRNDQPSLPELEERAADFFLHVLVRRLLLDLGQHLHRSGIDNLAERKNNSQISSVTLAEFFSKAGQKSRRGFLERKPCLAQLFETFHYLCFVRLLFSHRKFPSLESPQRGSSYALARSDSFPARPANAKFGHSST